MQRPLLVFCLSIGICFVLGLGAAPSAQVNTYVEDFTTTTFADLDSTTADWNTAAGHLLLYPLPQLAGALDTPGRAWGVYVSGDHAFVADYDYGLQVIDISEPSVLTVVGSYDTPDISYNVFVAGDHAYVADGTAGLLVVDISDPSAPTLAGNYDTPVVCVDVVIAGGLAYVADYTTGLLAVDISDPSAPTLVGTYDTPGPAWGVFVAGDHAYVADGDQGLHAIDITDPAAPSLAGSYDTPGFAIDVVVAGNYAYVADLTSGLQVIDITDPTVPTLAGSNVMGGDASGVFVTGNYAFVANRISGLHEIDISDPSAPTLVSTVAGFNAYGVFVSGSKAYVAAYQDGLRVFEVLSPISPALAGSYVLTAARDVAVDGDYAYVTDAGTGLDVIDISDPSAPSLAGSYTTPDDASGVFVAGDHAYVANGDSGLQVIDIADPTTPSKAGSYITSGWAFSVTVSGDYAFVSVSSQDLEIVDVSDPTTPALAGTFSTNNPRNVFVSGNLAYVADQGPGVKVLDISDPTTPTQVGSYHTPGETWDVFVSGDIACVAANSAGLVVLDVSDPTSPSSVAGLNLPDYVRGVVVSGDLAFLANYSDGLAVVDISDPTNPTLVGDYITSDWASDVVVSGEHAFVTANSAGLQVIQVRQTEALSSANLAQSLMINSLSEVVVRARISATQVGDVQWELRADPGQPWTPATLDEWTFPAEGSDLRWRSTLNWTSGANPYVSQMSIEWHTQSGTIVSIEDVPDDQGGWARLRLLRSGYDFAGGPTPLLQYFIQRRYNDAGTFEAAAAPVARVGEALPEILKSFPAELPLFRWQNRYFTLERSRTAAAEAWEIVASAPAIQQDEQIILVPTLADSMPGSSPTAYRILAQSATPGVFYYSAVDSGYSLDNIAPGVPEALAVAYNTGGGNQLAWDPAPEPDFQYYRIYRGTDPGFVPGPGNLVHSTASPSWTDPDYGDPSVHYKVTALDHAGNESDPASPDVTTGAGEATTPTRYALHQNVPNPFNPMTTIRYSLPEASDVSLVVYDAAGHRVRTLVGGSMPPGNHEVPWDGVDDDGVRVASGVYFYRLEAGVFVQTRRMVLIR